ncbi:MAG: hypothetical protein WDO24_18340 [Pseudomonadota bacterium]
MVPWLVQHGGTVLRTRRRLFYTIRASFSLISMLGSFYASPTWTLPTRPRFRSPGRCSPRSARR